MSDAQSQTSRLQALAESAQLFAEASTDLPRLLNVVARRFSELIGEATNIRLIEGDNLVPVATYHPDAEINEYLRTFHDQTALRFGEGISGQVISTGEPYFMPVLDVAKLKERLAPAFWPIFDKIGIRGMIVVRLRARGINLGYLSLFRTSPERPPYTRDDLLLVQDLADRAALAVDTSRLVDDLERRVAERTEALETSNRELEAFAVSVSHDLRSPLRAIDGFSVLLEEHLGASLDDEGRELLSVIRGNAQRMAHLTESLLRLSRLGHGAIEPITKVDMRSTVVDLLARIRAENPAVILDARVGNLPVAHGNEDLLRQVWSNLLENAVKYSRRKPVTVIEIEGRRDNAELAYTVVDHGAGFDSRYADKLFAVFQRLHSEREFEGTGVGLALVHRIVSRHGGRVWATGRIDEGATFGFALPERAARV
jgi:signal transduction histidine kinase